jgi:hypothetical protein
MCASGLPGESGAAPLWFVVIISVEVILFDTYVRVDTGALGWRVDSRTTTGLQVFF